MNRTTFRRAALAFAGFAFTVTALAFEPPAARAADSAEERGLRIAAEARQRDRGFGSFTASLTMTLRNKQGKESRRALSFRVIEVEQEGDRTLFVFDRPRDVKGTGFLVHAKKNGPDDQWLYLPALKRVKRISSATQSGSFMGSEFSYEDMASPEVEKYHYRYLRGESCGSLQCHVIERIPKNRDSGYSRQIMWLDQDELRNIQIQYFDRSGTHLKTMAAKGFKIYAGRFWRPEEMSMTNHLTGKSTMLNWQDYTFGAGLDLGDFTQTALKRAR